MSKLSELGLKILQGVSGATETPKVKYKIFNKIIGFKGVVDGVGCSSVVASIAIELANRGLNVCVVDTSILYPAQRHYLKTSELVGKKKDWFDLGFNEDNTGIFKYSRFGNIAVLGFEGRDINTFVSNYDKEVVVKSAFNVLEPLYDILLVDICSEVTNITTACGIYCHEVYQVCSDEMVCLANFDQHIKNMSMRCCNGGKMRNVILNKCIVNDESKWGELLKKYNFEAVATIPFSLEYYQKQCLGIPLYKIINVDEDVDEMRVELAKVCDRILNIKKEVAKEPTRKEKKPKKIKQEQDGEGVEVLDGINK